MRELGKRARSVRARKTLDGGVETFPARPRYRPQALEGGTSPRRRDRFDQPKLMTGEFGERQHRLVPRPRRSIGCTRHERRPAFQGLRRMSWTGWERLYVLR